MRKQRILWLILDVTIAVAIMLGVWIVNYRLPQKGIFSGDRQTVSSIDWSKKFPGKFTGKIVRTKDSYTSPDLAIFLSRHHYDSGVLDQSEFGKHVRYGTEISYVVADIYIANINCLQTAFAQDTYGVGYSEKLSDMASRKNAILAIDGDSYSNYRNANNGTIIRNGRIYRAASTDMETCVLNKDGTMQIYAPGQADVEQMIQNGAYQSWIFGPSLLDANGHAKKQFVTWDYIRESHPRTAIGYYEPGHYCMILVDGRQSSTRGMFLEELAAVFEKLGCKAAYNLDGGHCSFMIFQNETANNPYKPEHTIADGVFLMENADE